MKVLRSWLEKCIEIPYSDEELSDKLSLSGTSVEAVEKGIDPNVVVVEIRNITPHPQADRLQLASVFDGTEELTVVCGAPNIKVGQKVPLARIGANLPAGKIEKAVIRGVESFGMLCASDELGLGDDHSGIFILPKDYILGLPLSSQLHKDTIFDLEITPNRGDCLSHIGVAREIAALTNTVVKQKPVEIKSTSKKISELLSISIENEGLCSQYQARMIENITVKESPKWLRDALIAIGTKPINNIVDVTNYIMYDLGQPLHAFDYNKIEGHSINVRAAAMNEEIVTLDQVKRKLEADTLVIADSNKPIAIAGVMGGLNSEINQSTKTIVLEAAEFDSRSIRKTAKKLNLQSEASYRFERGIDSGNIEYALNYAAVLITEVAGGNILSGITRSGSKSSRPEITINAKSISKLLGLSLSQEEISHILRLLGFQIKDAKCIPPYWRHDIERWQDLAEEIGRISGYDKITPISVTKTKQPIQSNYFFTELVKDILSDNGFTEVINYSFLSLEDTKVAELPSSHLLEVANPIQPENKYLRNSLIPGLLKTIAKNSAFDPILIFEIGHIYSGKNEIKMLGIAAAGKNIKSSLDSVIKLLSSKAGIDGIKTIEIGQEKLGKFKIRKPIVSVLEIALDNFAGKFLKKNRIRLHPNSNTVCYRPISKYPSVTRDLAFILDSTIAANKVKSTIFHISDTIIRVELFDEFVSDKFGAGKKNLAFHLSLQHTDKTLTDKEADEIIKCVVVAVEKQHKAKLRTQ